MLLVSCNTVKTKFGSVVIQLQDVQILTEKDNNMLTSIWPIKKSLI